MDTPRPLPAEIRRLNRLAAAVRSPRWVVVADRDADLAARAAAVSAAPVLATVLAPNPLPAIHTLSARGLRVRVHVVCGSPLLVAATWRQPVGLLCLPAVRSAELRALLPAWGALMPDGAHVMFYGGPLPSPGPLDVSEADWIRHQTPTGGLFLLTRRPHG